MERLRYYLAAALLCVGVVFASRGFARLHATARAAKELLAAATTHQDKGEHAEAEACARRAIALLEDVYGANGEPIAEALKKLGEALSRQRRFAEARPVIERALAQFERAADDWSATWTCNQLGDLETAAGRFEAAERWHRRMLRYPQKDVGRRRHVRAWAARDVADALVQQGKLADARLQRTSMLSYPEGGRRDSFLADYFWPRIAWVEDVAYEWTSARDAWLACVQVRERVSGPKDESLAEPLMALARARLELGDQKGARDALERARALAKPEKARTALGMLILDARLALMSGDTARSRAVWDDACRRVERASADERASFASRLFSDHTLLEAMAPGTAVSLEAIVDEMLAAAEKRMRTRRHPVVAWRIQDVARIRLLRGDARAALALLDESIPILEDPEHKSLLDACIGRHLRGRALVALGRRDDARREYERVRAAAVSIFGAVNPLTKTVERELAALVSPPSGSP